MNAVASLRPRPALRAATRVAHDRVDAQFANGFEHHADYAAYLRGMHAFVTGVEHAVARQSPLSPAWRAWSLPQRIDWLRADLHALSLDAIAPPPLRLDAGNDDDCADARAAGAMYVVEGSALGARGLLGGALRLGVDRERGACFLQRHAHGDDGRRWPRFAAALDDDLFAEDPHHAALLQAANAAFAHADVCFTFAREGRTTP